MTSKASRIAEIMDAAEKSCEPVLYQVNYKCGNCGKPSVKSFNRGETAPDLGRCSKCGCFTARKTWQ